MLDFGLLIESSLGALRHLEMESLTFRHLCVNLWSTVEMWSFFLEGLLRNKTFTIQNVKKRKSR